MKRLLILSTVILCNVVTFSQDKNIYMTFSDFQNDVPSKYCNFQLKQRTSGDIFMIGGIANYRLKKIVPTSEVENLTKYVWGIQFSDSAFINSNPFSKIFGYNKIIEKGYYSYFIGEPARLKEEQIKVGIIKDGDQQKAVCCQTGYVILPDGTIKWLNPDLLKELIKDNAELSKDVENRNLKIEDVYQMFEILHQYNRMR